MNAGLGDDGAVVVVVVEVVVVVVDPPTGGAGQPARTGGGGRTQVPAFTFGGVVEAKAAKPISVPNVLPFSQLPLEAVVRNTTSAPVGSGHRSGSGSSPLFWSTFLKKKLFSTTCSLGGLKPAMSCVVNVMPVVLFPEIRL